MRIEPIESEPDEAEIARAKEAGLVEAAMQQVKKRD